MENVFTIFFDLSKKGQENSANCVNCVKPLNYQTLPSKNETEEREGYYESTARPVGKSRITSTRPGLNQDKTPITKMLQRVAMIFAVLVTSMANIGVAWGETVTATYSHSSSTLQPVSFTSNAYFDAMTIATSGTVGGSTTTGARCNLGGNSTTTITFTFTAKSSFNISGFSLSSYVNSNDVKTAVITYKKNSESPITVTPAIIFTKDSEHADDATMASPISMNDEDVFTVSVSINNSTGTNRMWVIHTITLNVSAAAPASSARTYDGTEKMYFLRDAWSWWNNDGVKFFAYFWNSSTDEHAWSEAASWAVQTTSGSKDVWAYTVPAGTWTHVQITRHPSGTTTPTMGNRTNWSNDITLEATTNLLTNWTVMDQDNTGHSITWSNITLDGKKVYFDNRNYPDWTSAYVRIGHSSSNSAWGPMTLVAGTRNLYEYETDQWDYHTNFSVANSYGWTGSNNIYQPWENQSWSAPEKITKQTTYQKYGIARDVYLCPTSTSMLERECQYYNVNGGTSTNTFEDVSTGVSLPSYTVTTTSAEHCTVTLQKCTNYGSGTYTDLSSGGTVLPTQYVKVTVTPDANYQFGSVEVTGAGIVTAAAAGTPGVYYITGDATITATCTCVALAVNRGGTEATPAEGEPLGTAYGTLTCSATTGVIASYQWKQNTSATTEGAVNAEGTGATTASFSPNPASAGTYYYYCVATDACGNSANTSFSGAFKFNAATYTVTYNKNGDGAGGAGSVTGTVPSDATSFTSGQRPVVKGPGDLAWDGHTFIGWNDKADGSGTYYSEKANFAITANKTLYAQWRTASSCPGGAGGTVFSLSMGSSVTGSDLSLGKGVARSLASYATISNGSASFTNISTSSDGKAKITKDSPNQLQFNGNDAMLALYLDCPLQNGDVITFTGGDKELCFTATASRATTIATSSKTLTINSSNHSSLIGKRIIYAWRSPENTFGVTALSITRPASNYTGLSVEKDPAAGSASAPTISATSVAVGSGVTVTAGAASSGYVFTGWTSENGTFADANSTSTTFTPNADNAVATANYTALKTITIKFQHNGNTEGWTIQSKTTYPTDQTATISVEGDWVVMTFSNVYAVSNIDLARTGGDWDYLNTSTKITDDACYAFDGTAINCATLTAIEANTLYQAQDMANVTFTGDDQWFAGLSTNSKFKVYGDGTSTSAFGKNENHSVTDDIDTKNFTSALYITAADNTSSASDPTKGAIEFITPSTAGTLYLYLNTDKSGLSIKKKGASSSTSLSGGNYKKINVEANTHYFINGSGDKRGLYGIKFIPAATYTVTYNGSSAGDGIVPVDGNSYTSGSTVTVLGNTGSLTRSIEGDAATFYGWNTNSNMYGGTHYNAGETFSITANTTLYAVWGYEITWNKDGGDWVDYTAPNHYIYGQGLTLPTAAKISKSGYTFDHWELAYNNSTITAIADDATGNVTLNAIWTAVASSYSVTYNGNDNTSGSVPSDATSYSAGDIVTVKGNTGSLVKTGQTFLGWSTSATASSGTFYPAGYKFEMPASNVTLYAVWGTGQVCYTITDFETSNYNQSSNSNKPDGLSKYLYGYMGTKDTEHALTLSSDNSNTKGQNSGVELRLDNRGTLRIYATNVTNATPAGFEDVTQVSFKAKLYNSSGSERTTPYTIKVGSTTVGSGDITGQASDGYFDISTGTLATPKDGYVAIILGGSGSNQNLYIDDIEICTGSGSSGHTVTFDNNGEGTYSKTITNVPDGSKIGEPIPAPTADGNTFGGWYKEPGCTNAWNFASDVVNSDKTLYAKWTNCLPTITTQPVGNTYTRGDAAGAMTVETSGDVTGYQWFSNDEDNATTGTPIDGQTTGGYTPTTGVVGITYYYCVVSNDCGSVASNVVAIVVNDDRLTPCAVWTIDEPTHGGQGFSFSVAAKKSDCSEAWDGTLTEGMLTVSEGVILGAITVDNDDKTISGTYGVSGTAESPVTFYLSLPRTDTHSAALLSQTRNFTACAGGAGEVEIPVLSGTTDGGSVKNSPRYWWETAGNGRLFALSYGKSDCASTSDDNFSSDGFNYVTSSNTQRWVFQPYIEGVTKIRIYIKSGTNGLTMSSIGGSNNWADQTSKYSSVTTSSITYGTANATNFSSNEKGYIEITFGSALTANKYYMFAMSSSSTYIYGVKLYSTAATDAGTITPTLTWSNGQSNGATLEKREDDVDFAVTANRNDVHALASLGTISYNSSAPSVATVNATTGQVTIADNIDFGSAEYKTTTITATLAASGCYKRAQITYVLQVNKYVCTEAVGTVRIQTDNGCAGKVLAVSGYKAGAAIQWYKDGEVIPSETDVTYNATEGGTYYVVTTGSCDAVSNEIKISFGTATATKIVDEWYVKNGRRTPDIALVQTTNATGFTVKSGSTVIWNSNGTVTTGFGGCGFYLGTDGIIYLKGQQDDGTEPSDLTAGDETITITASACGAASGLDIVIHKQEQRGDKKPEIAFVVDGGVGKAVDNVSDTKTSNRALWTYLTSAFYLKGCNIYWTTDEKALRQYYSQYDAILITDDPNTRQYPGGKDEKISATKGYVNAMGTLIDVRPMLTMEAYVSRLANWDCVKGTPYSPSPRDYVLKLQCKEHAIYKDLEKNGTTVRQEEIDGIDHWYVTMVDASNKTYADTDDETDATGTPALQGFDGKVNAGMLGIGTIADETLQGGIERQAEPAARMMVLGINNKAMAALTDPGKKVIMNALTYLLHTDMETLEDCSNYFDGQDGTSTDWFTAANWSAGKVPDPTVRAVILAPCEIAGATPARASSVDIAVGGRTGRYKSGASDCEGHLTIAATGALVVSEGVRRIEDAPNFGVDNRKPTQTSDLYIASTSANGNGTLIFDNPDGNTQATVGYYSKATTDENETWNWQYMAVPFNDNSSAYRNFYDSYLYRWAEDCSGWEVVPNRGAVYPWVGYTITQVGVKTYYMDGTLVETGEQTFTVPTGADLVLGNSWTAPLQIKQFEDDDFDGLVKNVYLFNTGYDYDKDGTMYDDYATHYEAGTYVVIPIHSSPYTGDSLISSLQAFTVTSEDGEGTLTLDYERHVRPARSTDKVNAGPMHAPSRMMAQDDKPEVLKIWASGQRFDDRLVVLEREDFSTGYDEGWDGEKVLMGEMAPTIYTVMENGYESVTATNDYEGTLIGFKAGEDNEYTFRFEYDDDAEAVYLLDTDERMYVRILTGTTYTFTCADKGEHNRFLLTRKAPGIATGCEPIDGGGGSKATKFIKDNKLYILLNGVLYDATGKVVE